jgi:hypothetical protein
MALYFYLLERDFFQRQIQPALSESWRQRRFQPCRELCRALVPAAGSFSQRFHLGAEEPLLVQLAADEVPFDRNLWRFLIGEILLFAAAEIPEIQTAPDTLCRLLAPECSSERSTPRARSAPIQQAHFGSRDLVFGGGYYRPEHAGLNDLEDVRRLAGYLSAQDPRTWNAAALPSLRGIDGDAERADELQYIQEWYPGLVELYQRAEARGQVIVCESL